MAKTEEPESPFCRNQKEIAEYIRANPAYLKLYRERYGLPAWQIDGQGPWRGKLPLYLLHTAAVALFFRGMEWRSTETPPAPMAENRTLSASNPLPLQACPMAETCSRSPRWQHFTGNIFSSTTALLSLLAYPLP